MHLIVVAEVKWTCLSTERETERKRETDRERDRQTDRQTDRERDRERQRERDRERERVVLALPVSCYYCIFWFGSRTDYNSIG